MNSPAVLYFYLAATIGLTVYGQLIIKARSMAHAMRSVSGSKLSYIVGMFTDLGVLSGLAAAVFAGVFWMLAIEKTRLSYAYPFMALSFVLVRRIALCAAAIRVGPDRRRRHYQRADTLGYRFRATTTRLLPTGQLTPRLVSMVSAVKMMISTWLKSDET
jgi:hypothetical protein